MFGGRGFVGSHIVREALNQGMQVVSINRAGQHGRHGNFQDCSASHSKFPGTACVVLAVASGHLDFAFFMLSEFSTWPIAPACAVYSHTSFEAYLAAALHPLHHDPWE